MNGLKSLADAQPGNRVSFVYYGGTDVGGERVVDVEEVRDDRIVGTDTVKGEVRQYVFDKAACVQLLPTPIEVPAPAPETEVGPLENVEPGIRTRVTNIPFPQARDMLVREIQSLNAEDLAEVLAEFRGDTRGHFDATTGEIIVERDVPAPTFVIDLGSYTIVNEESESMVLTSEGSDVTVDGEVVDPEQMVRKIAKHLGLTIA